MLQSHRRTQENKLFGDRVDELRVETSEIEMEALDQDIVAVRAQINAHRQRHSLLRSALLSTNDLKSILQRPRRQRAGGNIRHQQEAIAAVEKSKVSVLASATRTTTGISAFRAIDPDPHASNGGSMFGIRLDIYSARQHSFKPPYFLLFRQSQDEQLSLHQHTVPAFVPIPSLLRRYMSQDHTQSSQHEVRATRQNVAAFVRAVRRQLVAAQMRQDAIALFDEDPSFKTGRFGLKSIVNDDPASFNVELHLRNGSLLRIRLNIDGTIAKSSVGGQQSGIQDDNRRLERLMVGFSGKLPQLMQKLQVE